jgi:hypothetical protein
MIIKFDEEQSKSISYVIKKRVQKIAFPGIFRVFWEDEKLIIEIFDETLIEKE